MKTIACKDMGIDCPWVGKAMTDKELMEKAKQHAMEDHKDYWNKTMSKMSEDEVMKTMKPYIKEE